MKTSNPNFGQFSSSQLTRWGSYKSPEGFSQKFPKVEKKAFTRKWTCNVPSWKFYLRELFGFSVTTRSTCPKHGGRWSHVA